MLLENAFALIFNWRVFLAYFSRTGTKTIVMVAVSLIVVYALDVDIVAKLVSAYQGELQPSIVPSKLITAPPPMLGPPGLSDLLLDSRFGNRARA